MYSDVEKDVFEKIISPMVNAQGRSEVRKTQIERNGFV